jgi:hypothetical protein
MHVLLTESTSQLINGFSAISLPVLLKLTIDIVQNGDNTYP